MLLENRHLIHVSRKSGYLSSVYLYHFFMSVKPNVCIPHAATTAWHPRHVHRMSPRTKPIDILQGYKDALQNANLDVLLNWPALSPDLNTIENCRDYRRRRIRQMGLVERRNSMHVLANAFGFTRTHSIYGAIMPSGCGCTWFAYTL